MVGASHWGWRNPVPALPCCARVADRRTYPLVLSDACGAHPPERRGALPPRPLSGAAPKDRGRIERRVRRAARTARGPAGADHPPRRRPPARTDVAAQRSGRQLDRGSLGWGERDGRPCRRGPDHPRRHGCPRRRVRAAPTHLRRRAPGGQDHAEWHRCRALRRGGAPRPRRGGRGGGRPDRRAGRVPRGRRSSRRQPRRQAVRVHRLVRPDRHRDSRRRGRPVQRALRGPGRRAVTSDPAIGDVLLP